MKKSHKYLLAVLLLFICKFSFSQKLSITDLIYIHKNNLEKVDAFLSNKHFEYMSTKDADIKYGCSDISYAYSNEKEQIYNTITKSNCSVISNSVMYYFNKNASYVEMKNQIKSIGYRIYKTENTEKSGVSFFYEKNSSYLILGQLSNSNGDMKPLYYISIRDAKL